MKIQSAFVFAAMGLLAAGCGKSLNEGQLAARGPSDIPIDDNGPLTCDTASRLRWQFAQPQPEINRKVDVLFVVDTSDSINYERERIARDFPAFVRKLPDGADYRIAVMEAHGGASDFSGRLYSPHGVPSVLSSAEHSEAQIQKYLKKSLCETEDDADFAAGEAGFYSFMRSLESDRLAEARAKGFYREDAGLAVVFVTDENDVCFRPELHGYTEFPHYVDGGKNERKAYEKYCLNSDGTERLTPAAVSSRMKQFKGNMPVSVGGVVHVDPDLVPCIGQDAIGHGILELLTSLRLDTAIEITSRAYAEGLAKLADLSTLISRLMSDFALPQSAPFEPSTLRATIDGVSVPISFSPSTRTVRVTGGELGQGGSIVNIEACPVVSGGPGGGIGS